ncbi:X-ray repair cross-complementing protein 5 [Chytridiales sp. JEL 0842]|nr:X-ray repair cross-complementing protein 5 [Chytridiales sp. JEL 0842]
MNKEATVILLDVNPSMWQTQDEDGRSNLQKAAESVQQMLHSKFISNRANDQVSLILVGANETDNPLAEAEEGQYEHIKIHNDIEKPSFDLYKYLAEGAERGMRHGDMLDGIIVAITVLENKCKKLKWDKQIYVLTDGNTAINNDGFEDVVKKAADYGVRINVIGYGFSDTDPPESDISVRANNERLLRHFAKETKGEVYDGEEALELLHELRSRSVLIRTVFRGVMSLGNPDPDAQDAKGSLHLRVWAYGKIMPTKLPSSKKYSKVADEAKDVADEGSKGAVEMVRGYKVAEQTLEDGEAGATRLAEDVELQKEDLVKAFRYGKDLVPFSEEDMEAMRLETSKGFSILGFVKMGQVKREWYMNNPLQVVSDPEYPVMANAFNAMALTLKSRNMAALVRYVRIDNAAPKLGILVPHIGSKIWCAWIQVPFKEDVREFTFPSLLPLLDDETTKPSSQSQFTFQSQSQSQLSQHPPSSSLVASLKSTLQVPETNLMSARKKKKLNHRNVSSEEADMLIDGFIDSMDLMKGIEEDGEFREAYKPSEVFNPSFQRMYQCINYRALHPESKDLPPIDPRFLAGILPLPELVERSKPFVDKIKEAFTITKLEEKKETNRDKFRRNLREAQAAAAAARESELLGASGEEAAASGDGDERMSFQKLKQSLITSVGTADPVGDFNAMISRRDQDLVEPAVIQMSSRIIDLIKSSFGSQYYAKAYACMKALRAGCAIQSEIKKYNDWLYNEFKPIILGTAEGDDGDGYVGFWKYITEDQKEEDVAGSVGPISSEDAPGESEISVEEAEAFFKSGAEPEAAPAAADEDDDEDLLGMLD